MESIGEYRETRAFVLLNRQGMHLRSAGQFAKVALRYPADVVVEMNGNVVSGKSILSLIALEAPCGCTLRVTVSGSQAKRVLDELEGLIARKFDLPDEQ